MRGATESLGVPPRRRLSGAAVALALALAAPAVAPAADHGDTALLRSVQRHDARITDLFAFIRDERLVLAVCLDPTVPVGATEYAFPPDLTVRIHVDTHSEVAFDDLEDLVAYGGTVVEPEGIDPDVTLEITFPKRRPRLMIKGLRGHARRTVRFFAGLRDDPFIRGPVIGRNVAALVIELPVAEVIEPHGTMLVWTVSKVPEIRGSQADLFGRALRSQFPENEAMNLLRPRDHFAALGLPPDVMIFDTSRHASFPNGRELVDDVVDLVGDTRVLDNDTPFPAQNDVPFLEEFPYLAPPH